VEIRNRKKEEKTNFNIDIARWMDGWDRNPNKTKSENPVFRRQKAMKGTRKRIIVLSTPEDDEIERNKINNYGNYPVDDE